MGIWNFNAVQGVCETAHTTHKYGRNLLVQVQQRQSSVEAIIRNSFDMPDDENIQADPCVIVSHVNSHNIEKYFAKFS